MSYSMVKRILKCSKTPPYKPIKGQKLNENDVRRRTEFCRKLLSSAIDFSRIIFSDEKRFHQSQPKNHLKNRYWSSRRPENREVNQLEAHPPSVNAWAALSGSNLIGVYFFESNVDQYSYQEMIDSFLWPKIREDDLSGVWFQQDGATAHCTLNSIELLSAYFDSRVIRRDAA